MVICEQCGSEFRRAPGEEYKRLCIQCWAEKQAGSKQLTYLVEKVQALEVQVDWLMYQFSLLKAQKN